MRTLRKQLHFLFSTTIQNRIVHPDVHVNIYSYHVNLFFVNPQHPPARHLHISVSRTARRISYWRWWVYTKYAGECCTGGGTGHAYCPCDCVWCFVLRLKGFHIPLARRSKVTVYTMIPPVRRFNPFCPKVRSERRANSRLQTYKNIGNVPDSESSAYSLGMV